MKTSCTKCDSSDAVEVYEDGHEFCFSCNTRNPNKERVQMNGTTTDTRSTSTSLMEIPDYRSYPIASRGISQEVVDYFNVKMSVDPDGKPASHFYPYTKEGQVSHHYPNTQHKRNTKPVSYTHLTLPTIYPV